MKVMYLAVLLSLVAGPAYGAKVQMGLNSDSLNVKKKIPVVIFVSNDILAPLFLAKLVQNYRYLTALFQFLYHVSEEGKPIPKDVLQHYSKIPAPGLRYLHKLPDVMKDDFNIGNDVSHRTASYLTNHICRQNPKYRAGLIVFKNFSMHHPLGPTNSIMNYQYCGKDPGKGGTGKIEFQKGTEVYEYPFSDQPLAHESTLRKVIEITLSLFTPSQYRFLLVVQSQGCSDLLFAPRFPFYLLDADGKKVLDAALSVKDTITEPSGEIRRDRKTTAALIDAYGKLLAEGIWKKSGISVERFFSILSDFAADFSVVVLDVNQVNLGKAFSKNVGTVYSSQKLTEYDNFPVANLFKFLGVQETDLEDRLRAVLEPTELAR